MFPKSGIIYVYEQASGQKVSVPVEETPDDLEERVAKQNLASKEPQKNKISNNIVKIPSTALGEGVSKSPKNAPSVANQLRDNVAIEQFDNLSVKQTDASSDILEVPVSIPETINGEPGPAHDFLIEKATTPLPEKPKNPFGSPFRPMRPGMRPMGGFAQFKPGAMKPFPQAPDNPSQAGFRPMPKPPVNMPPKPVTAPQKPISWQPPQNEQPQTEQPHRGPATPDVDTTTHFPKPSQPQKPLHDPFTIHRKLSQAPKPQKQAQPEPKQIQNKQVISPVDKPKSQTLYNQNTSVPVVAKDELPKNQPGKQVDVIQSVKPKEDKFQPQNTAYIPKQSQKTASQVQNKADYPAYPVRDPRISGNTSYYTPTVREQSAGTFSAESGKPNQPESESPLNPEIRKNGHSGGGAGPIPYAPSEGHKLGRLETREYWPLQKKLGLGLIILALGGLTGTQFQKIKLEAIYQSQQAKRTITSIVNPPIELPPAVPKVFEPLKTPEGEIIEPVNREFSLVVPSIGINSPIVAEVDPSSPTDYKKALKEGVAHANTSFLPDENGTVYLFSHSTNYDWFVKDLNAVFYHLKNLSAGENVVIFYKGVRYTYAITEKRVVKPKEVSYLVPEEGKKTLILQTCWPPGSTTQRLLIFADLVEEASVQI